MDQKDCKKLKSKSEVFIDQIQSVNKSKSTEKSIHI